MRKLITFLISLLILFSCKNQENDSKYNSALKQAAKENKTILLDFSAIWCGGCKAYDKYIFNDSIMNTVLDDKFIVLKIDRDDIKNKLLIDKYKIHGLPHIVLINSQERVLGGILGFRKKYVDTPKELLIDINNILALQIGIDSLKLKYQIDTTNIETLNKLIKVYKKAGHHTEVEKLKYNLVLLDPTPQRLLENNFDNAINSIKTDKNAEPLIKLLSKYDSLSKNQMVSGNSQLLYYYQSVHDTVRQDYYYKKLVDLEPDYFTKKYIRFLFEHHLNIDTAILLTNEILKEQQYLLNDHWGQFLKAHSLVYQDKTAKAVSGYNKWMIDNENRWLSGDSYWPLYFYASFANSHKLDLENALDYITFAVEKRNTTFEKLLMSDILYKLGDIQESIDILLEVQSQINKQDEYERINKLIKQYQNEL